MTAHILLFWLTFPLLVYFLILFVSLLYHRVCQQQYLLLCCSVFVLVMLIMKFYNRFLQIWHLLSQVFSLFLQINCIMYIQSQILYTALDIFFEPFAFFLSSLSVRTWLIYSWRSHSKEKRMTVTTCYSTVYPGNRSFFLIHPLFSFFFPTMPSFPYASFSVFSLTSYSHHRH